MQFQIKGSEPLEAMISVRLTDAEKERLREDADLAGLSVSELVRRRYFGRKITAHVDLATIRELRRIGGLLKHINNSTDGKYSNELIEALNTLKLYIEKLSKDDR